MCPEIYRGEKSTHENTDPLPSRYSRGLPPRVPTHTEKKLENQENDQINFQAWKSPGKEKFEKILEKSWNYFSTDMKLELSIFIEEINDH